ITRADSRGLLLYEGDLEGSTGFYLLAANGPFVRGLVRSDRLFTDASGRRSSVEDIRSLREQCGCSWVAIEDQAAPRSKPGPVGTLIDHLGMRPEATFKIDGSWPILRIALYRMPGGGEPPMAVPVR